MTNFDETFTENKFTAPVLPVLSDSDMIDAMAAAHFSTFTEDDLVEIYHNHIYNESTDGEAIESDYYTMMDSVIPCADRESVIGCLGKKPLKRKDAVVSPIDVNDLICKECFDVYDE